MIDKRLLLPQVAAVLLMGLPAAMPMWAQSCTGMTDFSGHYMYVATRQLISAPLPSPDRVTNVEPVFSATAIGETLKGTLGIAPFATVGRIVADGQGGLYAAAAGAVFITNQVGSYTVTPECTLNMTLTDGFLTVDLIAPPTPGTAKFTGVLQSRGGESNLIQVSGGDGTSLSLARAHQANSCADSTFSGAYGLAARGVQWTVDPADLKPDSLGNFTVVGRIVSDGAGNLFQQDGTQGTPLQLTGTYSLLADCSGTAKITDANKVTRTINFVLTQANPGQNFTAIGISFSRPVMRFVIVDRKVAATGEGREATGRL